MGRAKTKDELVEAANKNFEKLWQVINSMSENALNIEFDFTNEPNKKEAHWGRDKNLRDVLIHLYEWHQLLLCWANANANVKGNKVPFLPEPYNWKIYGDMNIGFWSKHQKTSFEDAKTMVNRSHKDALALIEAFSNEELFTKQYFNWTGTTTLGSYCISAMSSHYDWATKKLRLHCKKVKDI
jgi:hypothetical protein